MESNATQSADFYNVVAWLDANRKRLIGITVAILVIAGVITAYVLYKNHKETQASEALSNLKAPGTAPAKGGPAPADDYIKLADANAGTAAAARALLIAGGIYFDSNKFTDAQTQFEKFLKEYPESPLSSEAMLGVAASLEAQGKKDEAAAKYKELIDRRSGDSVMPQAKSALARIYEAQNKPELALPLYRDLAEKAGANNDTWSAEAPIQMEELLTKYPKLRPAPPAPAPSMPVKSTMPLKGMPGLTNAPVLTNALPVATNKPQP
jgi:predicted negative regulator of RcsB-dependent stress response